VNRRDRTNLAKTNAGSVSLRCDPANDVLRCDGGGFVDTATTTVTVAVTAASCGSRSRSRSSVVHQGLQHQADERQHHFARRRRGTRAHDLCQIK